MLTRRRQESGSVAVLVWPPLCPLARTRGNPPQGAALSHQQNKGKEIEMSDPRYHRDPNRRATPVNREATAGPSSIWVAAIVAILVIAGIAAYTYRNAQTASNSFGYNLRPIDAGAGIRAAGFHPRCAFLSGESCATPLTRLAPPITRSRYSALSSSGTLTWTS
jgi:hypothetical protein